MAKDCESFWAGPFGDAYTARCRVDWRARVPFWRGIIDQTGARSVCEVGTNAGWNLSAIQRIDPLIRTYGCEVNDKAHMQAVRAGLSVARLDAETYLRHSQEQFDLTFTAGALIHLAPEHLRQTMDLIVGASADYVLAVEYEADKEEPVEYRGNAGRLWKRPYGKLYEGMGLTLVGHGAAPGFDSCAYWLFTKRPA